MEPHRLFVGTIGEGIWRSTDGGASFSRLREGLFVECHVRALVPNPHDPSRLFMGTELGLFHSADGGDHWQQAEGPIAGKQVWSIGVLPHDPRVILAGTCPSRLFRSEDAGKSWHEPPVKLRQDCGGILWTRVTTIVPDPIARDTFWAGVEIDGAWRSRDAGLTWSPCREGLSSQDIHDLAIVPMSGGRRRLVASTNNDLNLSNDDGATWTPLGLGKLLPYPYFRGLGQRANDPLTLFVGNGDFPPGTVGTVGRSQDGGSTWLHVPLPAPANSTIWNFATHPADPKLIYCSSVHGELYRSTDGSGSWEKLPREFGEIRALRWLPG